MNITISTALIGAGMVACLTVAAANAIGNAYARGDKWRDNWRTLSSASSSLQADMDRLKETGASASSSMSVASIEAEGALKSLKIRSEAIVAQIAEQARSDPGLDRPVDPRLLSGIRDVHGRVCADAAAEGRTGFCAGPAQTHTDDEGAVRVAEP